MNIKHTILTSLFLLVSMVTFAQNYTVSGYVKDSASGEALGNSFVSTTSAGKFVDAFPNA